MRLARLRSVRRWGQIRGATAAFGVLVLASMIVAPPLPVRAEPVLPAGATRSAPKQPMGSAAGRSHKATTGDTAATPVGPAVASTAARPEVPGAVGPEQKFADPVLPTASVKPQTLARHAGGEIPARTSSGVVPGMSREVPTERTPRSTVFVNPDGTKTRRLYQDDAFVRGQRGAYVKADPTLVRAADGRWAPVAAAPVSLAPSATDSTLATIDLGGGTTAGFRVEAAAAVDAQVGRDGARYPDVRTASDLVLTPTTDGLKRTHRSQITPGANVVDVPSRSAWRHTKSRPGQWRCPSRRRRDRRSAGAHPCGVHVRLGHRSA